MKPIPISAAKRIAEDYGYDQVIIIARKVGENPQPNGEHCTTYGVDKAHCDVAARIGDFLKFKVMGWQPQGETKAPAGEFDAWYDKNIGMMAGYTHKAAMRAAWNEVAKIASDLRAKLESLREVLEDIAPIVERHYKREAEAPANHQEFQQEARERLERFNAVRAILEGKD